VSEGDEQAQKKSGKPIGSVSNQEQYVKFGGRRPKPPDIQPSGSPAVQTSSTPDLQTSRLRDLQQLNSPEAEKSSMSNIKKSKHPDWKQQTIYLPPALMKWLRVQAPQEEREISEIVVEALEEYRRRR